MTMQAGKPIGLALSGGGARCLAQIGVLKALEEAGYRPDAIAANSSAAVLAAVYATVGSASELERIVLGTDFGKLLDLGAADGLSGHDGIMEFLATHAAARFEELKIPLAVPTVDIEKAELLVFSKGSLAEPVCASNAFPGLFAPVLYERRYLMDGGIINNFPIDIIRTMTTSPVLAVDVRTPIKPDLNLGGNEPAQSLLERATRLFSRDGGSIPDILMQAYNITQDRLIQVTAALHPPDVTLKPALSEKIGAQSFHLVAEAIQQGYDSAREAFASGLFSRLERGADA